MNTVHKGVDPMPKIIENPRQRLLDTARTLLIQEGASAFNLRQVTKASGIGLGTFYNYFEDKNDLLKGLFRIDFQPVMLALHKTDGSRDLSFKEILFDLYSALSAFLDIYHDIFTDMATLMQVNQAHKEKEKLMGLQSALSAIITDHPDKPLTGSRLNADQMSFLILQNFLIISRSDDISFDDWYHQLFRA